MKKEYYVIVDVETLGFSNGGYFGPIEEADKFTTLENAKNEMSIFDEGFEGVIYKVTEIIDRRLEIAR